MPTPHFKLLLHALRLGQPQDPQAAIRAIAEAIAVDHAALEDLKAKFAMMQARAQNTDAKVSLIEADVVEARLGVSAHYEPPGSARPPAPPRASPSQRPPSMSPPPLQPTPMQLHQQQQLLQQQQQQQLQQKYAPPQPQAPQAPQAPAQPYAQALPDARAPEMQDQDSEDEFHGETAVITRGEVAAALKAAGAPFKIAPAGGQQRNPLPSIPGAPWAHNSGVAAPIPTDDYTMDVEDLGAAAAAAAAEAEEGETYADTGVKPPRPPRR